MTNDLLKSLLVGASVLAFVGCGGGEESSQPEQSTQQETDAPAETPTQAPAEAPGEEPEAMTQETPEGTTALFIAAMSEADYENVLAMSDSTSVGYTTLETFVDSLNQIEEPNEMQRQALDTMRTMFTEPWKGASSEAVSIREDDGRARMLLTFSNGKTLEVDLIRNEDELWMLFLPERFMESAIGSSGGPPGQAG